MNRIGHDTFLFSRFFLVLSYVCERKWLCYVGKLNPKRQQTFQHQRIK